MCGFFSRNSRSWRRTSRPGSPSSTSLTRTSRPPRRGRYSETPLDIILNLQFSFFLSVSGERRGGGGRHRQDQGPGEGQEMRTHSRKEQRNYAKTESAFLLILASDKVPQPRQRNAIKIENVSQIFNCASLDRTCFACPSSRPPVSLRAPRIPCGG